MFAEVVGQAGQSKDARWTDSLLVTALDPSAAQHGARRVTGGIRNSRGGSCGAPKQAATQLLKPYAGHRS